MKRRSLDVRRLAGGIVVIFGVLAFFTKTLVPLEKFLLERASSFMWWYMDIARTDGGASIQKDGLRIVGRKADEYQMVLLLDRTLPDGSKIVSDNVLVGIVRGGSKIEVISSPFFKIQGILERSGVAAEFEGKGAGLLETRVPRGVSVERGETVWYDNERLLLLGKVAKVVDVSSDPFITIFVEHSVNFSTLWLVESL